MSWRKVDEYHRSFKKFFRKRLCDKNFMLAQPTSLVVSGQYFWENGRNVSTRPSHSHRLFFLRGYRSVPVIVLKGHQNGVIDVFVRAKTLDVFKLCNSRALRILNPRPDVSTSVYTCVMSSLELEGSALAGEICAAVVNSNFIKEAKI